MDGELLAVGCTHAVHSAEARSALQLGTPRRKNENKQFCGGIGTSACRRGMGGRRPWILVQHQWQCLHGGTIRSRQPQRVRQRYPFGLSPRQPLRWYVDGCLRLTGEVPRQGVTTVMLLKPL